jgi:hypothetical protein
VSLPLESPLPQKYFPLHVVFLVGTFFHYFYGYGLVIRALDAEVDGTCGSPRLVRMEGREEERGGRG